MLNKALGATSSYQSLGQLRVVGKICFLLGWVWFACFIDGVFRMAWLSLDCVLFCYVYIYIFIYFSELMARHFERIVWLLSLRLETVCYQTMTGRPAWTFLQTLESSHL